MHTIRFQPGLDNASSDLAKELLNAVLNATDPSSALRKHYNPNDFTRPTHILAFGKAAISMTNAAMECLGDRFARATVITSPALCAQAEFKNKFIELLPAHHPFPIQQNIDSTNRLIEHAQSIPDDHQALVLISGGTSAMLCSPKPGVALDEIVQTTKRLLNAGESIHTLNSARSKLETLKAGGLADLLKDVARTDAFVLSDVIGDDPATIGSGPVFQSRNKTIKHTNIANNQTAVDALCAWMIKKHIEPTQIHRNITSHASEIGNRIAQELIASDRASTTPIAVCAGGEPTVDTANASGIGGPMLELALACAAKLSSVDFRWTIITLATDGIDGPTDAAGAIITHNMISVSETIIQVQDALANHDALTMCDTLHATIRTGPTGTNVNDIALAIRWD